MQLEKLKNKEKNEVGYGFLGGRATAGRYVSEENSDKGRAELSPSGAEGGGLLQGGLEGGGDGFLGDGEAAGASGEPMPFGPLKSEKELVDIVKAVLAAGQGGLDRLDDGKRAKDICDGLIEKGVSDREQAHKEEIGFVVVHVSCMGKLFAEIRPREGGADQFGRLAGSKSDNRKDGDPTAKLAFAQ